MSHHRPETKPYAQPRKYSIDGSILARSPKSPPKKKKESSVNFRKKETIIKRSIWGLSKRFIQAEMRKGRPNT